jgi:hypothetical protein
MLSDGNRAGVAEVAKVPEIQQRISNNASAQRCTSFGSADIDNSIFVNQTAQRLELDCVHFVGQNASKSHKLLERLKRFARKSLCFYY